MQQAQPVQQKHQQQTARTLIDLETRFWRSFSTGSSAESRRQFTRLVGV